MDIKDFRKNAHDMVDWMADYMEGGVRDFPVRPVITPGEIKAKLPAAAPIEGESFGAIFKDFKDIAVPGLTHWQHPRFFGYFPANSSPPSVLAEMLTAALGVNVMMWETSPAATEIEEQMLEWLRDMSGLPHDWQGVIQDTASTATLCAVLTARERATAWQSNSTGMRDQPQLTYYTSSESHSSVMKAIRIAGIGDEALRSVPLGDDLAMDAAALKGMIADDILAGRKPAGIVATVGTTSTGAVDPIRAIGEIANTHNIHFHVDSAWAGSAMICPEFRSMIDGLELADSFVSNPHKWLMTNFDCSVYYVKDAEALKRTFSIMPAYLKTKETGTVTDYRDWGIPLGRRFRAMKLWFVMRSYGVSGLQKIIRNHIAWAGELAEIIKEDKDFEIVTGPNLSLISFRVVAGDERESDSLTEKLVQLVNDDGYTYLTRTIVKGRPAIRIQIGQTQTTQSDVQDAWKHITSLRNTLNG